MPPPEAKRLLLVGGGAGAASLAFMAAVARRERPGLPVTVALGAPTAEQVLCADDFHAHCLAPRIATDDGSLGTRGTVVDALNEAAESGEGTHVLANGPPPMLRAVAEAAKAHGWPCHVALQAHMPCAVGTCSAA